MKERLVRGTSLASVVRVLRAYGRERPLPDLGPWERDLLQRRVSPTTWYSLKVFDSLLQLTHRFVFDGSESAAQNMGRAYARAKLDAFAEIAAVRDPLEALSGFAQRWRDEFNFGEVTISPLPAREGDHGVRVRIAGYPDMSACHGHSIMGFTLEVAQAASAQSPRLQVEERPWMHNSVLSYTLCWD
jgi:hypothetical protein